MPTVTNKTKRPLSVPLPGGKKLFLVPGKSGQIAPKAADFPPLVKLVESGDLELVRTDGGGPKGGGGGGGKVGPAGGAGDRAPGGIRQSGDR